jgi:two-component system, cell cycle response regulator DivK
VGQAVGFCRLPSSAARRQAAQTDCLPHEPKIKGFPHTRRFASDKTARVENENILVVEDNPMNVKLIRLLLFTEGYQVRSALSAGEALEALCSFLPDAVIMDIQLPDINGLQLTRLLRQDWRTREIPIVAVSANAMKQNIQEAYAAGCDGYITKPINTRTFVASLREQLAGTGNAGMSAPTKSLPDDEVAALRRAFAADCKTNIESLMNDPGAYLDREAVRDVLHRCAGMAGSFGHPHLTAAARDLGSFYNSTQCTKDQLAAGFRQLLEMLAEVRTGVEA